MDASNRRNSLLDNHPCTSEACRLVLLSSKDSFLSGFLLSKVFRRGELDGREPLPFPQDSRFFSRSCFTPHLSFSSRARTFCCPLFGKSAVFAFALSLTLSCSSARGGLFKLSFTRKEMLLTILLLQVPDPHLFKSCVVSRFTLLNSIWIVQRQQWLQLV